MASKNYSYLFVATAPYQIATIDHPRPNSSIGIYSQETLQSTCQYT
jgi:hypothetical protein